MDPNVLCRNCKKTWAEHSPDGSCPVCTNCGKPRTEHSPNGECPPTFAEVKLEDLGIES